MNQKDVDIQMKINSKPSPNKSIGRTYMHNIEIWKTYFKFTCVRP